MTESDFINVLNEHYPYERYIVQNPKPINYLFDDAVITELFVPNTEIKPLVEDGKMYGFTSIDHDEIYVKIKGPAGEMRFAFYDFSRGIRETIIDIILDEFDSCWEDLYIENDCLDDLNEFLEKQKNLIIEKYGECKIKPGFDV